MNRAEDELHLVFAQRVESRKYKKVLRCQVKVNYRITVSVTSLLDTVRLAFFFREIEATEIEFPKQTNL